MPGPKKELMLTLRVVYPDPSFEGDRRPALYEVHGTHHLTEGGIGGYDKSAGAAFQNFWNEYQRISANPPDGEPVS